RMEHVQAELGVRADATAMESPAIEEEVVEVSSNALGAKRKKSTRLEAAQLKEALIGETIEKKQTEDRFLTRRTKAKAFLRSKRRKRPSADGNPR
ncbi:MAG: hypothetical protein SGPRY_013118, partial [Prymnesium sp.]